MRASPDAIGIMRQYVLGLVDPSTAYELIGKTTEKFVKSASYKSKKISPHKIEITVTPHKGVEEEPFQCENRIGFLEAISLDIQCQGTEDRTYGVHVFRWQLLQICHLVGSPDIIYLEEDQKFDGAVIGPAVQHAADS
jgi:hypothetical protein